MKNLFVLIEVFLVLSMFSGCAPTPGIEEMRFDNIFSIPREPRTSLAPEQRRSLDIPAGKKVLITDIYIENLGGGISILEILEQRGENSFEVRYTFKTDSGEVTILNFTTGLKLGDEIPIAGRIVIANSRYSSASILPRVNGLIVP